MPFATCVELNLLLALDFLSRYYYNCLASKPLLIQSINSKRQLLVYITHTTNQLQWFALLITRSAYSSGYFAQWNIIILATSLRLCLAISFFAKRNYGFPNSALRHIIQMITRTSKKSDTAHTCSLKGYVRLRCHHIGSRSKFISIVFGVAYCVYKSAAFISRGVSRPRLHKYTIIVTKT